MVKSAGGRVIAVDFSEYAVKRARVKGLDVVLASATNLPFRREAFDMALVLEVLDEMPRELASKVLSEVKIALKRSGGVVIQVMPNKVLAYVKHKLFRRA